MKKKSQFYEKNGGRKNKCFAYQIKEQMQRSQFNSIKLKTQLYNIIHTMKSYLSDNLGNIENITNLQKTWPSYKRASR